MLPVFPGELVWTFYACVWYPRWFGVAYFVGQLLLELMTYIFGAFYNGFGVSGMIVLTHAWLHEIFTNYGVFWFGESGD